MFKGKRIAVVVPAYNEEKLLGKVIKTMPAFVDAIIIINDCSKDKTKDIILEFMAARSDIILIDHAKNEGLGKSLIDGYYKSLEIKADITVVMAGDAQMDPEDLPNVITPIAEGKADYAKGNRLLIYNVARIMPKYRFIGNAFLTLLSKFATGYWHIIDPQCGYTAISHKALQSIHFKHMTKGYGYNADLLNMLNLVNAKVVDVEVRPVYGEAKTKIRLTSYVPRISVLLVRLYIKRMVYKYLVREFHPLIFFYLLSFVNLFIISTPLTLRFFYKYAQYGLVPRTTLMILTFSFMMGFFSFFFGMWLDMEENRRLNPDNHI